MPLHHYVPQFILRGFADERNQLRVVSRQDPEQSYTSVVRNTAAEKGFYTIQTEDLTAEARDGHDPEILEATLAEIEAAAASDIHAIRCGLNRFEVESHYRLARLTAFQLVRIPRFRRDYVDMANVAAKDFLRQRLTIDKVKEHLRSCGRPIDDASVQGFHREVLEANYSLVPNPTHLIQKTLGFAVESVMPELFQRVPKILRFQQPSLLTSDAGAGLWAPGHERHRSPGIAEARAIFLPLDRTTALAFMKSGTASDRTVDPIWANHINLSVADAASSRIYHHPSDDPLSQIDLPDTRKLVEEIDSIELLGDGKVRVRGKRFWE